MSGEALEAARTALAGEEAWLVGGAVRDRLLGRETDDVDLAIPGDPKRFARRIARRAGGAAFELSGAFGAWRVVGPEHAWHVDLVTLRDDDIRADLAHRDFTINAMAEPLGGGELLDPHGGRADLERRVVRMVSERALVDDPLRSLRAVRIAVELDLEIDAATGAAAAANAHGVERVAPERVFAELKRVVSADAVRRGLELMATHGLTDVVLPELTALRGIEQSPFHHADVHDHTLEVLDAVARLQRDPVAEGLGEEVGARLAEPLSDELTRGQAMRFAALLHDAAKPQTRGVRPDGRVTFIGHDVEGARLARDVLGRLRSSQRLRDYVAALVVHHLDAGFLVHQRPLDRRTIWRYLRATQPYSADITAFTVADRLSTRGRNADAAIAGHLDVARELLAAAFEEDAAGPPRPLVRGDELVREAGVTAGPRDRGDPRPARGGPLRGRDQHPRRGARPRPGAGLGVIAIDFAQPGMDEDSRDRQRGVPRRRGRHLGGRLAADRAGGDRAPGRGAGARGGLAGRAGRRLHPGPAPRRGHRRVRAALGRPRGRRRRRGHGARAIRRGRARDRVHAARAARPARRAARPQAAAARLVQPPRLPADLATGVRRAVARRSRRHADLPQEPARGARDLSAAAGADVDREQQSGDTELTR